jgi:hypothetical protein
MAQRIVPNPDAVLHVGLRRAVPRDATVAAIAGARRAGLATATVRRRAGPSVSGPSVPGVVLWARAAE